jgi:hypothetical protein
MLQCSHDGDIFLDATVRIAANNRRGLGWSAGLLRPSTLLPVVVQPVSTLALETGFRTDIRSVSWPPLSAREKYLCSEKVVRARWRRPSQRQFLSETGGSESAKR